MTCFVDLDELEDPFEADLDDPEEESEPIMTRVLERDRYITVDDRTFLHFIYEEDYIRPHNSDTIIIKVAVYYDEKYMGSFLGHTRLLSQMREPTFLQMNQGRTIMACEMYYEAGVVMKGHKIKHYVLQESAKVYVCQEDKTIFHGNNPMDHDPMDNVFLTNILWGKQCMVKVRGKKLYINYVDKSSEDHTFSIKSQHNYVTTDIISDGGDRLLIVSDWGRYRKEILVTLLDIYGQKVLLDIIYSTWRRRMPVMTDSHVLCLSDLSLMIYNKVSLPIHIVVKYVW